MFRDAGATSIWTDGLDRIYTVLDCMGLGILNLQIGLDWIGILLFHCNLYWISFGLVSLDRDVNPFLGLGVGLRLLLLFYAVYS